ncbi:UrcA family protein [Erythrobacter insulae]|nr:UrcA family protein [Erythrobacter insulae]
MKILALAGASFGLAITATPAFAAADNVKEQTIQIDDLNLETAAGQKTLDRRIDRVARSVCGVSDVRTGTRIRNSSVYSCVENARASAKRQVAAMIDEKRLGG